MKFRVYRGTFDRGDLVGRIDLKTLTQMDELPIYGNEPRVRVRAVRGPWQEVEIRAHSFEEIDTKAFWRFLEDAVRGFLDFTENSADSLEDHTPWKKLGRKWHFLRKGFPPGKRIAWDAGVLEELHAMLCEAAPQHQFLWNNQMLVRMYLDGCSFPWASLLTKRPDALVLVLTTPKGSVSRGRISTLGCERELDERKDEFDFVRIHFRRGEDLHRGDLPAFLQEHLELLMSSAVANEGTSCGRRE